MDEATKELQEYLRLISVFDDDIPTVVPDGIFASETTLAVKAFQEKHGFPSNGRVDFSTWEKLVEEYDKVLTLKTQPLQAAPIKNEDLPLRMGKASPFNRNLKLMLSFLAEAYDNFDILQIDDVFDEKTHQQVRELQKIIDTEQNGVVDKEAWNMLTMLYLAG